MAKAKSTAASPAAPKTAQPAQFLAGPLAFRPDALPEGSIYSSNEGPRYRMQHGCWQALPEPLRSH